VRLGELETAGTGNGYRFNAKELRVWRSRRNQQDIRYFMYRDLEDYFPADLVEYYRFARNPLSD